MTANSTPGQRRAIALASMVLLALRFGALSQNISFTYQGRLNDAGLPANGLYDLSFQMYDSSNGVNQIGETMNIANQKVSGGIFTVVLGCPGDVFDGSDRWLQIGVRTNGAEDFVLLTPRQSLTASPYAVFSNTASNLLGVLASAQLSGTYTGQVSFSNGDNQFGGAFTGDGSGLTNLPGTSLPATVFIGNNTNTIYCSGAELTLANGQYDLVIGSSPARWVNAANGSVIVNTDDSYRDGFSFILTNVIANTMYGATFGQMYGIAINSALFPAVYPSFIITDSDTEDEGTALAYYSTNAVGYSVIGAASAVNSNNVIYVSPTGSDSFWLRGHPDLPMQTLSMAAATATNGDIVSVSPGAYTAPSVRFVSGVSLVGWLRDGTVINGTLSFMNVCVRNLTITGGTYVNGDSNCFDGVNLFGGSDSALVNGGSNVFRQCNFNSSWDGVTFLGGTSELYDCHIKCAQSGPSGAINGRGLVINGGSARFYNGSIEVYGFTNLNTCVDVYGSGSASLFGTSLASRSTGANTSWLVHGQQGGTNRSAVTTYGFIVDPAAVLGQTVLSSNVYLAGAGSGQANSYSGSFAGNGSGLTNLNLTVSFLPTNAIGSWPRSAASPGGAAMVNSNGAIYLLVSKPGSTAWNGTNFIAGPR